MQADDQLCVTDTWQVSLWEFSASYVLQLHFDGTSHDVAFSTHLLKSYGFGNKCHVTLDTFSKANIGEPCDAAP